jgi:hypothetical protein
MYTKQPVVLLQGWLPTRCKAGWTAAGNKEQWQGIGWTCIHSNVRQQTAFLVQHVMSNKCLVTEALVSVDSCTNLDV